MGGEWGGEWGEEWGESEWMTAELSKYGGTSSTKEYGGGRVLYQVPIQVFRLCMYIPNKYRGPRTALHSAHDAVMC